MHNKESALKMNSRFHGIIGPFMDAEAFILFGVQMATVRFHLLLITLVFIHFRLNLQFDYEVSDMYCLATN